MKTTKLLSLGTALLLALGGFTLSSPSLAETSTAPDLVASATVQTAQARGGKIQNRGAAPIGQTMKEQEKGNRLGKGIDYSAYNNANIDGSSVLTEDEKTLLKADLASASSLLAELESVKTQLKDARTKLKEAQKAGNADLASLQAAYDTLQAKYVETNTGLKNIFAVNATVWAKLSPGRRGMRNANAENNPNLDPTQGNDGMGKNKNRRNVQNATGDMSMPGNMGRCGRGNGGMGNMQAPLTSEAADPAAAGNGNAGGRGQNNSRRNNGVQPVEAPAGFGTTTNP